MTANVTYVEILKRAREIVSRTNNDYICDKIAKASRHCEPDGDALMDLITRRLYPYAFLGSWLIKVHGIDAYKDIPKLQATRIAWIDDLIKEFS